MRWLRHPRGSAASRPRQRTRREAGQADGETSAAATSASSASVMEPRGPDGEAPTEPPTEYEIRYYRNTTTGDTTLDEGDVERAIAQEVQRVKDRGATCADLGTRRQRLTCVGSKG